MSDLKDLTALPDTTTFPDHTLSPPRLIDFAEAEEEAAAQYLRGIAKAAAALPAHVRDALHQRAVDNLRAHPGKLFLIDLNGTEETSHFGPTACTALWRCTACREPFEHMRAHRR